MTFTKNDISRKLREYPSLMRIKQQLEFELTLPVSEGYSTHASKERISPAHHDELAALLCPVETELRRMETYIKLIREEDGAVLKALYFDGLSYKETEAKLVIDAKTIVKRKNRGLAELAVMYSRLPDGCL